MVTALRFLRRTPDTAVKAVTAGGLGGPGRPGPGRARPRPDPAHRVVGPGRHGLHPDRRPARRGRDDAGAYQRVLIVGEAPRAAAAGRHPGRARVPVRRDPGARGADHVSGPNSLLVAARVRLRRDLGGRVVGRRPTRRSAGCGPGSRSSPTYSWIRPARPPDLRWPVRIPFQGEPATVRHRDPVGAGLRPAVPGEVGVYLCGLTVQSPPHIGHLRSAVNYDVLRRWLLHSGLRVTVHPQHHRHRRQDPGQVDRGRGAVLVGRVRQRADPGRALRAARRAARRRTSRGRPATCRRCTS